MRSKLVVLLGLSLACAFPCWATEQETKESGGGSITDNIKLKGWGVRVGLSSDPDQIIGGFHWDLGRIVPKLRLQPNVELGVGDDAVTLFGALPVHYLFDIESKFTPYAGGSFVLGLVRLDRPRGGNDTNVEAGLRAIGGLQWPLKNGKPIAVEVNIGLGDIPEFQAKVAWTF